MSDKKFWEKFYSNKKGIFKPSPFALFLIENKHIKTGNLIELGCGNGRDSLYFSQSGINVLGIDQCENVVYKLNSLKTDNAEFKSLDFTKLDDIGKFNIVYSRFTLHSINKIEASNTMSWAYEALEPEGKFCIEVRSIHDELYGQGEEVDKDAFVTDHYRRFVNIEELVNELIEIGFKIEYQIEDRGLAVYKNEDPVVIRIIAVR